MRFALPLLVLAGCGFAGADNAAHPGAELASPLATRVEVVALRPTEAHMELTLPGEVIGERDVVLAAGNGGLVEAVQVKRGDVVRQGKGIARVDAELFSAQLAQAEAQASQATHNLERLQTLGDLASPADIENAQTNARVAEANEQQARARLARAAIQAPFDGVVADVFVEKGGHLGPGGAVARLVKLDTVRVTLSVADRDVVSLEEGMPVEVRTNARSGLFQGEISHVGRAADLRTRAFPVEVKVPNPDGALLPGMIAQVHLYRSVAEDAVVVPQDWIVTRRSAQGVFVEEDGVARWHDVSLGDVAGDQIVVLSGLEHGDRVVITGHRELKDGDTLLVARAGHCCTDGRPTWGD